MNSKQETYIELLDCIEKGKNEKAKSLLLYLQQEAPNNFSIGSGLKLVQHSVKYKNVGILQYLINIGCNINIEDENGRTPLLMALENQDVKVVKVLLENNADIYIVDRNGWTSLQHAVHGYLLYCISIYPQPTYDSIFQLFIDRLGKDFLTDKNKVSQFISSTDNLVKLSAAAFGGTELTKFILKNDRAGIYTQAMQQYRALYWDSSTSLKSDIIMFDARKRTPFYLYIKYLDSINGQFGMLNNIMKAIFSLSDRYDLLDGIQYLLMYGSKQTVITVFQSNIDVTSMKFSSGRNFLHLLIENKNDDVLDSLTELNHRFSIDVEMLMLAIRYCSSKKVECLLNNGADANFILSNYKLVLFFACRQLSSRDDKDQCKVATIVELLLQYGADAQFLEASTILHVVFGNRILEKLLIAHFAMLQARDNSSLTNHIRDRINSIEKYENYFDVCMKYLVSMKTTMVYEKVDFFDLLNENQEKVLMYARNQEFLSAFDTAIVKIFHVHSYYTNTVCRKIAKAKDKIQIDKKAAAVIKKLTGLCDDVHYFIVYKIIDSLDTHDLRNLCRVKLYS